jgi:hypothetical protein
VVGFDPLVSGAGLVDRRWSDDVPAVAPYVESGAEFAGTVADRRARVPEVKMESAATGLGDPGFRKPKLRVKPAQRLDATVLGIDVDDDKPGVSASGDRGHWHAGAAPTRLG